MINIEKAEEEFRKYTNEYDETDSNIERKIYHTFRVEDLCEKIAISIGLNQERINLAKLIGLLHDIARFEQYTIYHTFSDVKSVDHGNFGVEILEKEHCIRKYLQEDIYDEIIKKAVYNHNKYNIQDNLTDEEKVFCKIIRDADKIDIMYEATEMFWKEEKGKIEEQNISNKVIEQFIKKEIIDNKNIKKDIDNVIRILAFIYDLNFKESYKIIRDNKYIDKIINRFYYQKEETKEQMELIRKMANEYITKEGRDK